MNEEWKDIIGYEGLYMVSNLGNVKSLNFKNTGKEQVLKPSKRTSGYLFVSLYKNKKVKHINIHKLVIENFIGLNTNGLVIDHIIESNVSNNRIDNLQYITNSENAIKGYKGNTPIPIIVYDYKSKELLYKFKSIYECAKTLNIDKKGITGVLRKFIKQSHGFYFEN